MIDYSDPNDPNYDPYWGNEEAAYSEPADYPGLSNLELEELAADYIREMREEGLLRPTLVKPEENAPQADQSSSTRLDYELELPF